MTSNSQYSRKLRIGIVGCGKVAEHHVRFIQKMPQAELVGVADVNESIAHTFAERHRIPVHTDSITQLMDLASIDVLHIATPPPFHYDSAVAALDRGIHVFIEKPVALTASDVHDLYDRAATRGVLLCPDFIQLFHPRIQQLLPRIQSGELGRILHVESYLCINLQDTPEIRETEGLYWGYRLPGGLLRDYGSHALYLALYFAGALEDIQVTRKVLGSLPQGLPDHFSIQIKGSRCTASVVLSSATQASYYGVRILCEKGSAVVNFDTQTLTINSLGSMPRKVRSVMGAFMESASLSSQVVANTWNYFRGKLVPYGGLQELITRFYQSIVSHRPPPVSRELAIAVAQAEETLFSAHRQLCTTGQYLPCVRPANTDAQRILVTGASGYLGYHTVKALLEQGYYVRAFARPTSNVSRLQTLGVEVFLGDVRREQDVNSAAYGMDAIVHLAAGLHGSREYVVDTCVRGTATVATVAAAQQIERVVYIGSFSVYDYTMINDGQEVTEESPLEKEPEARGAYASGKVLAEQIALSQLSKMGPAWTILRPSLIIGADRDLLVPLGAKVGSFVICTGTPRKRLALVHVEDVATAIVQVLQNDSTRHRIYTVCHPQRITARQYVRECLKKNGPARIHVLYLPYSVARLMAFTANGLARIMGRPAVLNKPKLLSGYRSLVANSDRLFRDTGWQPQGDLLARVVRQATNTEGSDSFAMEQIEATHI